MGRLNCATFPDSNETKNYVIKKSALEKRDIGRHGWTYGLMVVPFKYDIRSKTFEQAGTLGPYLAYGDKEPGHSFAWTLFMGVTQVPVTTTQNNVKTTTNENGYSVATGPIWVIKENFTIGLFSGIDYIQGGLHRSWTGVNFGLKTGN